MDPVSLEAFLDELDKIASTQMRSPSSSWAPKSIGAPRSKVKPSSVPKPPTAPGSMAPKMPKVTQYGQRQNYSKPNASTVPGTAPAQSAGIRNAPPPNVVFGVR
jgi:hypothetical protein